MVPLGVFVKSSFSFSNGNCVEVGAFLKSSFSDYPEGCVPAAAAGPAPARRDGRVTHLMVMRDDKQVRRAGARKVERGEASVPVQRYTLSQWHKLICRIADGALDDPLFSNIVKIADLDGIDLGPLGYRVTLDLGDTTLTVELMQTGRWAGWFAWKLAGQAVTHRFKLRELVAFIRGVKVGEFDLPGELEKER